MQKIVMSALVLGLLLADAGLFAADDKVDVQNVYKETNGNWRLTSSITDGTETPAEELKEIRMELKDGGWTFRKGDTIITKGTFTIVSVEGGVRLVSTKRTFGEKKGNMGQHISKSEGDTLTVCHGPEDNVAPKDFTSKKGSGNTLRVWKRIKETEK